MPVAFAITSRLIAIGLLLLAGSCGDVGPPQDDGSQAGNAPNSHWVTGDVPTIIQANELTPIQVAARRGDNSAAQRLSEHYRALGQTRERLDWLILAASRGDCASMALLKGYGQDRGDAAFASRWNGELRANRCTWAKAYGRLQGGDPRTNDMPLWDG